MAATAVGGISLAFLLRRLSLWCFALAGLLLCSSCSKAEQPAADPVLRLRDGRVLSFPQMLDELRSVDFVLVGEIHNSMVSHRAELRVIEGLLKSGRPLAVGLEMFWARSQPELYRWVQGQLGTPAFTTLYYQNWGFPWPYYRDILNYAKKHAIPLVGLNIPPSLSDKVAAGGFASLSDEERAEVPPLSCDITPDYRQYIRQVYKEHLPEGETSFQNFCEAQVLWDKTMAWHLTRYLEAHPDRQVVVLAGLTHALERGIPSRIKEFAGNGSTRVIVPLPPGSPPESIPAGQADYLILP